jgi:hypothetical protein
VPPVSVVLSDADLVAFGLAIPYAGEREAKNSGQYGVALRWTAESIDTEFGLLLPALPRQAALRGLHRAEQPRVVDNYFINYGEDKDLFASP